MTSYEERAKNFLARIYPIISNHLTNPYEIEDCMDRFNEKNNRNVVVHWGSARVAIITSDYVIKWEYDQHMASMVGGFKNELGLYERAKEDGFAYMFAKITPFTYQDFPFYIMPRIEPAESMDGVAQAWECMTEAEADWCFSQRLSDLHEGNFGFQDGHICIFDYGLVYQ